MTLPPAQKLVVLLLEMETGAGELIKPMVTTTLVPEHPAALLAVTV
jgi:hypothetical protein